MAIYYYKVGGSNANGGTNATTDAWETPAYGMATISGGDTLRGGAGTYILNRTTYTDIANGTAGNPTIVENIAGEAVVWQWSGTVAGIITFSNPSHTYQYITFQADAVGNFILDAEDQGTCQSVIIMGQGSGPGPNNHLEFINVTVQNSTSSGVQTSKTQYCLMEGCLVQGNGTTLFDHGVYAGWSYSTMRGCTLYNNSGWGIHAFSSQVMTSLIFEGNRSYNNGTSGSGAGMIIFSDLPVTDVLVQNNLFYGNPTAGISAQRGTGIKLYHNTIDNNGGWGIDAGQYGTSGIECKNNLVTRNTSGSIKLWAGATGAICTWNRISSASITNAASGTTVTNNSFNAVIADEVVDTTTGDYHLKAGATSIGATTTNEVPSVGPAEDFYGAARVQGLFTDQGAAEYADAPPDAPSIGHSSPYVVTAGLYNSTLVTLSDNDSDTTSVSFVGTNVSTKITPTANVTVTSP